MFERNTSQKAYEDAVESGSLQTQKGIIYELVKRHGPATQREIEAIHYQETSGEVVVPPRSSRFAELEKDGLIKATGTRQCTVTGKTVLVWEADPENRLVSIKPQSKSDRIKQLEATIERISKATTLQEVRDILGLPSLDSRAPESTYDHTSALDIFDALFGK